MCIRDSPCPTVQQAPTRVRAATAQRGPTDHPPQRWHRAPHRSRPRRALHLGVRRDLCSRVRRHARLHRKRQGRHRRDRNRDRGRLGTGARTTLRTPDSRTSHLRPLDKDMGAVRRRDRTAPWHRRRTHARSRAMRRPSICDGRVGSRRRQRGRQAAVPQARIPHLPPTSRPTPHAPRRRSNVSCRPLVAAPHTRVPSYRVQHSSAISSPQ